MITKVAVIVSNVIVTHIKDFFQKQTNKQTNTTNLVAKAWSGFNTIYSLRFNNINDFKGCPRLREKHVTIYVSTVRQLAKPKLLLTPNCSGISAKVYSVVIRLLTLIITANTAFTIH